MSRIAVLVEGQTEEAFVHRVLQPHLGSGAYLTPIVVHTSRAADGSARRGGGSWKHYERMLATLLMQPHWSLVTTLLDYYGYPPDAPACACERRHIQPACVESREQAIAASFPRSTVLPYIALHEFETAVIAAGAVAPDVLGNPQVSRAFRRMVDDYGGNAELINDGPTTAPSKRVAGLITGYDKVRDGVAIIAPSFEASLALTPRFQRWVGALCAVGRGDG